MIGGKAEVNRFFRCLRWTVLQRRLFEGALRLLGPKYGADDVAGLADLVVTEDADGLILTFFGLTGGDGRRGVVKGEARALGGQQLEDGLAFDAAVEVDGVSAVFLGGEFHTARLRDSGERRLAAIRIKLAAGGEHIERTTVAIRETTGGFEVIRVTADFRNLAPFQLFQLPGGDVEVVLLVEHRLRGILQGGEAGFQGCDLRRRPADARGDGVDFSEVVGRPVHEGLGAVRDVVFAWHGGGWVKK